MSQVAERYSLATAAAGVGVWDWNLQSGEFHLDPNIKRLLGYEDHEIANDLEVWSSYIYPDDKEAVMGAARDAIEGRSEEYVYEHRMRHKDGSVRWFMVRGKVVRDRAGVPVRFVGTDTDITERRQLEQHLRGLSNEIQTRVGHDLHDSLGQELTALTLRLRVIEQGVVEHAPALMRPIREARKIAGRAIETAETLARGLSPVLTSGGLAQSLGQLTANAERLYGIECRIDLPESLPEGLSGTVANELYRIAQEAVTNAVRHGQATRVEIGGRIRGARFFLQIVDNGEGFVVSERADASMGLRIMQYRARHLGGSLTISRRRDGGMLLVCVCPIPK